MSSDYRGRTNRIVSKRWAVALSPANRVTCPSRTAAYRMVERYRVAYAAGTLAYSALWVYVDERDGRGWQTHERVDLREWRGGAT